MKIEPSLLILFMREIAEYHGVHYATISRSVNRIMREIEK